jgi:hypothetical protein
LFADLLDRTELITAQKMMPSTSNREVKDQCNIISDKELSECGREDIGHIGLVQGGCGHVLFIKNPSEEIVGHDGDIEQVEFIKSQDSKKVSGNGSSSPPIVSNLVGGQLKDVVPGSLHNTITQCVAQMTMELSRRTFSWQSIEGCRPRESPQYYYTMRGSNDNGVVKADI